MPKVTKRRFLLYLGRWQLSTIVLAPVIIYTNGVFSSNDVINFTLATILANFIGACLFWFVDKYIFRPRYQRSLWEIKGGVCRGCGEICDRLYRLVKAPKYDRLDDQDPVFLCEKCSMRKTKDLRERGVVV